MKKDLCGDGQHYDQLCPMNCKAYATTLLPLELDVARVVCPFGCWISPAKTHATGSLFIVSSKPPLRITSPRHTDVGGEGVVLEVVVDVVNVVNCVVDVVVGVIKHEHPEETRDAGYWETYVGRG